MRISPARASVAALMLAGAGCTALLGGDSYEVVADGGASHEAGGHDAGKDSHSADATKDVRAKDVGHEEGGHPEAGHTEAGDATGADSCPPLPTLSSKAEFESELCGSTCTPGSNAELADNPLCKHDGGLVCHLPAYDAGVDSGSHDAGSHPDAGSHDDGGSPGDAGPPDADAAHDAGHDTGHDAGPTLPKCSALPPTASGFTYPSTQLYAIGSTAMQTYVAYIAQLFAAGVASASGDGGKTQVTVLYAGAGSCLGVEAAFAPVGSSPPPINTLAKTATYYDPTLDAQGNPIAYTCELDSTAPADVGVSDVFPSSCTGLPFTAPVDPLPAPYYDFFGPVQVMEMLVPTASSATTITYEEAGLVWGYGAAANVPPWTDPDFLFRRSASSGTQTMISLAVGLDPRVWVGVSEGSSTAVKTALLNVEADGLPDGGATTDRAANAAKTIGILASDVGDGIRQSARPLAFQDRGESCAWLPDSSSTTYDKKNVRTGRYPIWGPSHFITTVNSSQLAQPLVAKLIAAVNGTDPDVSKILDVVGLYATSHIVPECAMQVQRISDGASYTYFQPPGASACGCYYDHSVPNDSTTCTPCTTSADCVDAGGGATSCNLFGLPPMGFCEVPGPE